MRNRRLWPWLVGLALMLWLPSVVDGYAALNYYSHLALGEARILLQRQPITEIIADPATSEPLRDSLQTVLHARRFASETLALPNNGSYTTYVDISRPYVMYNVLATPELSLQPIRHCFLFAGCVAYKGFYSLARARASAARLRRAGNDVYIVGVPAYSTLGVFSDPVLSTMGGAGNLKLIGTIFHELAHQAVYIKGATAFNESFATFVSRQGLRQWRNARQLTLPDRSDALQRQHEFTQLVLAKRRELADLYASDLPVEVKRERKQGIFDELRAEYRNWRDTRWNGQGGRDNWIDAPFNNAKLLPFGLYDQHVQAFAQLFQRSDGNWQQFYGNVRAIGSSGAVARKAFLNNAAGTDGRLTQQELG